ncbi:hypothetical protein R3P38DRAFT_3214940 [Favolaschia claudopus]|uniref:Fungal N-terminal domain-containing protein n=1 Tax=Favolaschia claudopus TaxID=2862362 RepID=A0AAW0AAI7_9AGAR
MDPVTLTTTILALGTFAKDLVDLGEAIRSSVEQVRRNRRQVRELTQDILHTLYQLASLTHNKEDTFCEPELLGALESLKAEMLYIHSRCLKLSPVQLSGLRGIPSHLKVWRKRDDLEKKIARLRENVNKCFLQFTASYLPLMVSERAFAAARTEHIAVKIADTTLRIEQRLIIDNVETRIKTRRLEGMVAQLLLESEFGRRKLSQTVEIISADPTLQSLESQYLSAQFKSLVDSFERLLASGRLSFELPLALRRGGTSTRAIFDPTISTPSHVLVRILQLVVKINAAPAVAIPIQSLRITFMEMGIQLSRIGMVSEGIAWGHLNIAFFLHSRKTDAGKSILPGDNWIGTLQSMLLRADQLRSHKKTAMLSTAQEAMSVTQAIETELVQSISEATFLTDEEVLEVVQQNPDVKASVPVMVDKSDAEGDAEYEEALETALVVGEAVVESLLESHCSTPVTMECDGKTSMEVSKAINQSAEEIFSKSVEIRWSMRSTLKDIVWWILVIILFAVLCTPTTGVV